MCLQRTAVLFLLGFLLFPINVLSADDDEDNPGLRSPTVNVIIINGGAINPTCDVNPVTDTCDSDDVTVQWFSTLSGTCLYGYSSTSSNPIKLSCTTDAKLQVSWVVAGINTFRIHASQSHTSVVYTSATITGIAPTPPPVPGAIKGPASTTGDYTLNWGSSTGATSYILVEQTGDNTDTTEYVVTGTSKSFTDKSNGNYSYQVKACVGSKYCSDLTATKTVTVTPTAEITINGVSAATCVIPAGATLCNTADVTVSWTSNVPGACVYVSDTNLFACSQGSFQVRWIGARTYTFKVHQSRRSDAPVLASATILPTPRVPSAITGSTNSKDGSYTLNWGSSRGTTMYTLQAMIGAGDWTTVQNTTTRSKSFSGKTDGTYKYRVKACSSSSFCSDWTATHTVTVKLNTTPVVTTIATQRVLVSGTQSVTVTVSDDDAGDTHTVTAISSNTSATTVSVSGKTLTITGKAVGSSTIRVTATDNSGATNATSAEVSFTVYVPPPVPGPITGPGDSTTGSYTLNWGSSTGATSYTLVERVNSGSWTEVQASTATSKTFTGKTDGTYQYRAKACAGSTNCSGWTATKTVSVGLNTAPVVTAIATQRVSVDDKQSVTVTITDSDAGDTHTVTAISSNTSAATVSVSGKTLTITGKAVGSSTIKVTATDNSGATNATSAEVSFTVYVPPPVPGSITGPGDSTTGSYTLSWGSSTGATSYMLQERLNSGNWSTVQRQNTATTTESFAGKSDGTYQYRAKACAGSNNCSGWTATHTVTVTLNSTPVVSSIYGQTVTPGTDIDVTVSIGSDIDVIVGVTDSDSGDSHTITAVSGNTDTATVTVSGKTVTVTGLASGVSIVTVTATDNSGASNNTSPIAAFVVMVPAPNNTPVVTAIATQRVSVDDKQSVTVTITDSDAGDTHTVTAISSNTSAATVSVSGKTLTITGKAVGSSTIRVTATDNSGATNATSAEVSFTVYVPPPVPGSITGPGASTDGSYTLSWSSSTGATSYTLQEISSGGNWSTVQRQKSATTTESFFGKSDGTYGYQVKACAGSNCSGWTTTHTVTVTLNSAPVIVGFPEKLTVSAGSTATVTVHIRDADSGDSHTIAVKSGNPDTATATVSGNTLTITGLATGVSIVSVTAMDDSGASNNTSSKAALLVTVPAPPADAPVVVAIANQMLSIGSSTDVTVMVKDTSPDVTSHTIAAVSSDTGVATVSVNEYTLTIRGVAAGSSTISVTATDNNDVTGAATTFDVVVGGTVSTGILQVDTPGTNTTGTYTLSWGEVTGATHYRLEESSDGGTTWQQFYVGIATEYTIVGKPDDDYQYQLQHCSYLPVSIPWLATSIESCSAAGMTLKLAVDLGTEPAIETQTVAGTIPYDAGVTQGGDGYINIPIVPAPGVNGLLPRLSIDYSGGRARERMASSLPGDTLGYGWQLRGFSSIRRCLRQQVATATLSFTNTDSLCLDGEPLVLIAGSNLQPGAQYRTLRERFVKVEIKGTTSVPWFEVKLPDGTVSEYGNSEDSRLFTVSNNVRTATYLWSVKQQTDAFGNSIKYVYHNDVMAGVRHPIRVEYGSTASNGADHDAVIRFEYVNRGDLAAVMLGTARQNQKVLLHTVRVILDNKTVRLYRLHSEQTAIEGWRRLDQIQLCAYDTAGSSYQCLPAMDIDWMQLADMVPDVETCVAQISDSLGRVTKFAYGTIKKKIEGVVDPAFLFSERPFGSAPDMLPDSTRITAGADGSMKAVVTRVQRSNGLGGWHVTHYAYQGRGRLSSRHWGFLGFDATRVTDVASGVVTYYQYRMDFPHFGEVSALHQYTADFDTQGYKVLFKQETVYSSENLSYLHTTTNTKVSTMLPYVRTMTDFHYEQGTQLGATQRQHTLTLSSNLPTGIATTSKVGHTVKSTGSVTLWGDVKTHTISAIQRQTASTVKLQNRFDVQWLIGFAKQVDQSYYLGGDMNQDAERTQRTTFTPYTNSLKVDTMVRYPMDTLYQLTTDHDYDKYGNRTSTTVSGGNVARGTNQASNFSNRRYPGTLNNALNHSNTLTYDTRFGSIKELTDANGRVTTMSYDPFGREISRTTPDNVVISTTYNACASATVMCSPVTVDGVDVAPVIKVTTSSPISPDTNRYLDKLGRVVRTEVQAFDGTSTTRHDVRYDNQGRIDRVRQPYYATATTAYYTQYSYDIRDRVTKEQRPDGGSTMLTYAAASHQVKVTISETVKKADGMTTLATQKTTDRYNVMGELVKTTEVAGNTDNTDAVSTEYTYDSQGLPLTVTVNGSYVNTFTYDAAGYRDTVSNANTGTVSFDFTALGELRQQTDTKGSTTYSYDLLRRVTAINDPEGIAIWEYDTTNAKGALHQRCYYSTGSMGTSCSSTTNLGFRETLSYNTDSRPSASSTRISAGGHNKSYVHSYTYDDDDGRLKTIAYPSGITASYGYNAHGYLATVDDTATTGVLETYNALDAYGNVTQATYGNGVKTQRAFAANSGRPTNINSTRSKGDNTTVQQKNEYLWQSNGQLQSRISHVGSMNARKEDFVYDHLNRLKSAKTYLNSGTSASRTLATTYDKLGNIDTKTSSVTADVNVTGYGYGSGAAAPGHHAVTSASIGGNAHTFRYDADGNMTKYDCTPATCEDKYIGWNKRNLPTTVTLGDSLTDTTPTAKDEFAYGPNGQRYYKKSTWDDAGALRTEHTFYVGRFEEVLPGDQPDYSSIQKTRVTDSLLHVRTTSADGMTVVSAMEYLHRDHLGSVEAVTDGGGASLLVQAYDPLGERRKSDWTGMLSASERQTLAANQPLKTSRGYTGHEHLDRTGFIHMNGRLYDPQLGRFLSPDPIVAAPGSSQSWNSYSYVSNSPLSYVDPGGQFQAGIGCNVGYVMCMNGGNTSGGGSSQGSDTATIRTYQSHTVYVVDWEPSPTWNPGGGGIYGRGDIFGGGDINNGTHGDIYGGIFGDVWGGHETIQYTPFVTTFSFDYWATETRQIQNPAEERSPASRPMGAGAQQGGFGERFQKITGMSVEDSISLYKAQTGEILTAIQVEKLFTYPEYARKQILASENLHKVYRGILNSNAPLTIAAAKERGFVQLKVIQSYFHNPWYNPWQNSKWIGPSGHLERVFDGQGNVILSNDYMGTFNFFGPNQTSNHWNADVVPFNKWGN